MDYLKSFVIGTSGPVFTQHLALLSLVDKNYYDYSYKIYSLLAPLYYGFMTMFALFIGNIFGLSLRLRLFITSIISIILVVSLSYFVFSKKYKPYKEYTNKEWLSYILKNGARHLVAFNIIIYFFEEYFSKIYPLKVFIIGSSALSYLITYLKVGILDLQDKLNYNYETFAVMEPFIQGFDLLIYVLFFHKFLKLSLPSTLLIWAIFGSILWLILAYNYQTYKYHGEEWINAFLRVLTTGIVKAIVIYYLLIKLN